MSDAANVPLSQPRSGQSVRAERSLRIALGLVAVVVASLGAVSYRTIEGLRQNALAVRDTQRVVDEIERLTAEMTNAESQQRGYLLTRQRSFLGSYETASLLGDFHLQRLQQLTVDNPDQQERWEFLAPLIQQRWDLLQATIDQADDQSDLIQVQVERGSLLMSRIGLLLEEMRGEEEQLLRQREEQVSRNTIWAIWFFVVVGSAVAAVLVLAAVLATRYLRERQRIETTMQQFPPMIAFSEQLAMGKFPQPLRLQGFDEVGQLGEALNVVRDSLLSVVSRIREVAEGNYDAELKPRSEHDELVLAFSSMTQALREKTATSFRENWLKTGVTDLNEQMRGEPDVKSLSQTIITYLSQYLNAQIGALYILQKDQLQLAASYAYIRRKAKMDPVKIGEGLLGQVVSERQMLVVSDLPKDYIAVQSGLGESIPRYLVLVPLIFDGVVEAVIELGFFHDVRDLDLDFLRRVSETIAVAFSSSRSRQEIEKLLEESQVQAEELNLQQQELQKINVEVEEKAELLTRQNREMEIRNQEIEKTKQALEQQTQQLTLTSKYKSEFLANMSHELRTPLNSMLILAQLLAENMDEHLSEEEIDYANTIYSAGNDLLNLINEILDLAKIESGTMSVDMESINLDELLATMDRTFRQIAEQKGLEFILHRDPDVPQLMVSDLKRLSQVIKNLLSNALKFTSQGRVSLSVGVAESGWRPDHQGLNQARQVIAFVVQDTGIGIPEDKHKVVFEAFQQVDGTTSRQFGGTGLGLSISREIADLLQGDLRLQSRLGQGSTFTFYLPHQGSLPPVESQSSPVSTLSENGSIQSLGELYSALPYPVLPDDREQIQPGDRVLLIIEDDVNFARILLGMARQQGFKGLVSLQGDTGLALAKEWIPTAIMLDLQLPVLDGWHILQTLKADPRTRAIPVHVISVIEGRRRSLREGAFAFLQKPVDRDLLEQALGQIKDFVERPFKKLLLIEDNEIDRNSIIHLIGEQDVRITAVSTGSAALEALNQDQFDCLIMDLGLPDMSGFELAEQVYEKLGVDHPPIIFNTAQTLTPEQETELRRISNTIVVKDARSLDRLLDETALFLHRVTAASPVLENATRQMDRDPSLANKKVLVVDDDVRNIFALTSVLEHHGLQVVYAEDGQSALDKLTLDQDIDLVLMDIMMPVMDGYEAMRQVRNRGGSYQQLPIIALTAKAMRGDREKCIEAGASDYITKPVDTKQLLSLLRVWLCQP